MTDTSSGATSTPRPDGLHEVTLPVAPSSPSAARRLVRGVLKDAGRADWADAAELAVSELVTNAVLHARTEVVLRVLVQAGQVRVEVQDGSPSLPGQRRFDAQATTGRGMGMVATLVSEHGVTSLGGEGKVVWFVLDDGGQEQSEQELLDAWADQVWDLEEPADEPEPPPVGADLLDLPPTLWLAARQHHDALLRELVLHLAEHDDVAVDLAAADRARRTVSDAVEAAVGRSRDAGQARPALPEGHPSPLPWVPERLDLHLGLAAGSGADFAALQDALDAAEQLAAQDRLLARPGLPEVVAVRDWVCEQVQSQLAGVPASAWPGTAQERFETAATDRDDHDWDLQDVLASPRGVVAADDANRVVGISAGLAAALGWLPADLVGRRVVTLIPARLREGHVAGFTRHLTTGEAHVLGVPLELPVLHADGSEVTCRFLVERADSAGRGRALYLAWIDPVQDDAGARPEAGTGAGPV